MGDGAWASNQKLRCADEVGSIRYRVVVPDPTRFSGLKAEGVLSRLATLRAFLRCMADEDYIWRGEANLSGGRRWAGPRRLLARVLENPRLIRIFLAPSFEVSRPVGDGEELRLTGPEVSGVPKTWVSRAAGLWGIELHELDFDVELALVRRPSAFDAFVPFAIFRPATQFPVSGEHESSNRPGIALAVPRGFSLAAGCPSVLARGYFTNTGPWTDIRPLTQLAGTSSYEGASLLHGVVPVKCRDQGLELLSGIPPFRSIWPSALFSPPGVGAFAISPRAKSTRAVECAAWVGATTSWYHFLVEGLCAYLSIEEEAAAKLPICLQPGTPSQIRELAHGFTGVEPVICGTYEEVRFERLWITEIPELRRMQDINEETMSRVIALRRALDARLSYRAVDGGKRYFLYRGAGTLRRLRNQRQIAGVLRNRGFEPIEAGTLSLRDQTEILRRAEIIVLESGAAFAGLLFCAQKTKVLEIGPQTEGTGFWGEFAVRLGLIHAGVWSSNLLSVGRLRTPGAFGYRISPGTMVRALEELGT